MTNTCCGMSVSALSILVTMSSGMDVTTDLNDGSGGPVEWADVTMRAGLDDVKTRAMLGRAGGAVLGRGTDPGAAPEGLGGAMDILPSRNV